MALAKKVLIILWGMLKSNHAVPIADASTQPRSWQR